MKLLLSLALVGADPIVSVEGDSYTGYAPALLHAAERIISDLSAGSDPMLIQRSTKEIDNDSTHSEYQSISDAQEAKNESVTAEATIDNDLSKSLLSIDSQLIDEILRGITTVSRDVLAQIFSSRDINEKWNAFWTNEQERRRRWNEYQAQIINEAEKLREEERRRQIDLLYQRYIYWLHHQHSNMRHFPVYGRYPIYDDYPVVRREGDAPIDPGMNEMRQYEYERRGEAETNYSKKRSNVDDGTGYHVPIVLDANPPEPQSNTILLAMDSETIENESTSPEEASTTEASSSSLMTRVANFFKRTLAKIF